MMSCFQIDMTLYTYIYVSVDNDLFFLFYAMFISITFLFVPILIFVL